MVCVQSANGAVRKTFIGEDCGKQLMEFLPANSITYFHNLGYDGRLLMKYGVRKNIMKGSRIIQQTHNFNGKKLKFKDSLSMIPQALAKFPAIFKNEFKDLNIQKELFPYCYYIYKQLFDSNGNINRNSIGIISECGKSELPKWTAEQKEQFIKNIDSIKGCRLGDDEFDMIKYCEFYCQQDVNVLRIGFNAFRELTLKAIELDIFEYSTAPGLANAYLNKNVFYPNSHLYAYSGLLQDYIMRAVYGGRCMTKQNKRWLVVNKKLADFDACSLYPSAMARLFTVEGIPRKIEQKYIGDEEYNETKQFYYLEHAFTENQLTIKENPQRFVSYGIFDIEITKVGIERNFPLIVYRDEKTGTNQNINANVNMTVDIIMLEDLVRFQKISFKVKGGIYWNSNRDHRIREVIKKLYKLRAQYKKEGNSMQEIFKLIMNSGYGKSIQKSIKSEISYKNDEEYNHFVCNNYNRINFIKKVDDSNTWMISLFKQLDNQFNNCVFGVSVLSMSKRIMNEVMCLAEELNIEIYYQDTDSMHIEKDKLKLLEDKYKEIYHRELIGTDMGCFHNDFDEIEGGYTTCHLSCGKKIYYDELTNDAGEHAEHYRMKGIPNYLIKEKANEQFNGSVKELYLYLYNGGELEFDLAATRTRFQLLKTGPIIHRHEFKRKVRATVPLP